MLLPASGLTCLSLDISGSAMPPGVPFCDALACALPVPLDSNLQISWCLLRRINDLHADAQCPAASVAASANNTSRPRLWSRDVRRCLQQHVLDVAVLLIIPSSGQTPILPASVWFYIESRG